MTKQSTKTPKDTPKKQKLQERQKPQIKQARPKLPHQHAWKIIFGTLGLLAWTAISVIASEYIVGSILVALLGSETASEPVWTAVYSAVVYVLALILTVIIPPQIQARLRLETESHKVKGNYGVQKSTRTDLGLRDLPTWSDIGLAPVGYIVYLVIAMGLVAIFSAFPWFNANEAQNVGFSLVLSGGDRIIAFITLVVIAPIAEEIIFRGWLYGKLRQKFTAIESKWGGMILANFLVSLLFGLIHLQWNVGVNVFALSMVLCALREVTGTIYAGILLHMLKNGIAFFLLYVLGVS